MKKDVDRYFFRRDPKRPASYFEDYTGRNNNFYSLGIHAPLLFLFSCRELIKKKKKKKFFLDAHDWLPQLSSLQGGGGRGGDDKTSKDMYIRSQKIFFFLKKKKPPMSQTQN